ncbi:MAG: DUF882 domain-containing protein, partial [Gammaproteobacteria bacterium]|nr:DUF882 domain-containing protein [Gammaproteobacteria bacterium]
ERTLYLYNVHTQEALTTVYWVQGDYIAESLREVYHLLRDHRSGEIGTIDFSLLDTLHRVAAKMNNTTEPFQIISGFRSTTTNQELHAVDEQGVAAKSLHTRGMAVDLYFEYTPLLQLHAAAQGVSGGGVGLYPDRFIHLDTGPERHWVSKGKG